MIYCRYYFLPSFFVKKHANVGMQRVAIFSGQDISCKRPRYAIQIAVGYHTRNQPSQFQQMTHPKMAPSNLWLKTEVVDRMLIIGQYGHRTDVK